MSFDDDTFKSFDDDTFKSFYTNTSSKDGMYDVWVDSTTCIKLCDRCINHSKFMLNITECDSTTSTIRLNVKYNVELVLDVLRYVIYHVHNGVKFPNIPEPIPRIHVGVRSLRPHVDWFSYNWVAHRSESELDTIYKIAYYFVIDPVIDIVSACIACRPDCVAIVRNLYRNK